VRHVFSNVKAIFRIARKMKFIAEDPAEDLRMPDTRIVKKPKIEPKMILDLIDSIPHPRDRALLAVGCFCGPRTSENLGLTWKSYAGDHFIVYDTAYEGTLYEGKVKTEDSRARIPIPERVRPYIEAWRTAGNGTLPSSLRQRAENYYFPLAQLSRRKRLVFVACTQQIRVDFWLAFFHRQDGTFRTATSFSASQKPV
jgi:integrase